VSSGRDLCGVTKQHEGRNLNCLNGANHRGPHRFAAKFQWTPPTLDRLGTQHTRPAGRVCPSCGATVPEHKIHGCGEALTLPI
jgi:hypothetical protein